MTVISGPPRTESRQYDTNAGYLDINTVVVEVVVVVAYAGRGIFKGQITLSGVGFEFNTDFCIKHDRVLQGRRLS